MMNFLHDLKLALAAQRARRIKRRLRMRIGMPRREEFTWLRPQQRGFTLIELMLSIAIVGILAGAAVVAYIPYSIKAQAAEGTRLAESAMLAGSTTFQDSGVWPLDNASAGYSPQNGHYTTGVSFDGTGNIAITYGNNASAALAGTVLYFEPWLAPDGVTVLWTCGTNDAAPVMAASGNGGVAGTATLLSAAVGVTTTPTQYLPKICHT